MNASGTKDEDSKDDKDSGDDNEATCPLFMEGLPRDFSSNPALAALASLLEEDEGDGGGNIDDSDGGGKDDADDDHVSKLSTSSRRTAFKADCDARMEEDQQEDAEQHHKTTKSAGIRVMPAAAADGGGKLRREKSKFARLSHPYRSPNGGGRSRIAGGGKHSEVDNTQQQPQRSTTTVGEAQLFVKMWKL